MPVTVTSVQSGGRDGTIDLKGFGLDGSYGPTLALLWWQTASAQTPLERGSYLVRAITACGDCHTPTDAAGAPMPNMELAGGREFKTPTYDAFSANLTPDKDTGIGSWTDQQIIRAMREGIDDEGAAVGPPMPVPTYNNMSDEDATAIVAYLQALKPVHNEVHESKYDLPLPKYPPAAGLPARVRQGCPWWLHRQCACALLRMPHDASEWTARRGQPFGCRRATVRGPQRSHGGQHYARP